MTPVYYELLGVMFKNLQGTEQTEEAEKETQEFFRDLKARQLMLGASSEMVVAFNRWQKDVSKAQEEDDDISAVMAWEELLLVIRKDLGHRDSDLARGELLRLFITDYDEYFPVN